MSGFSVRRPLGARACSAGLVLLATSLTSSAYAKDPLRTPALPGRIDAQYSIALGAFDLGHFKFEQRRRGKEYTLKSVVELSALLGAFKWRGVTQTSGLMSDGKPTPKHYAFDYRSKSTGGLVRMEFDQGNVISLSAIPSAPVGGGIVPLKRAHTRAVLDPLTAILKLAYTQGSQPCGRTLPIFDGKQRFNLTFNFRRYEALPAGQIGHQRGIVCQIKYKPLGGFVANGDTQKYAAENNIEVAFRSVGNGMMVPYRLSLPTIVGTAQLDLRKLSVRPARARMASAHP